MPVAYHIGNIASNNQYEIDSVLEALRKSGHEVYRADCTSDLRPDTMALLSIGGDGTFLSSVRIVADTGVPILGVNTGHLGFLSEAKPDTVVDMLLGGKYSVDERNLLEVRPDGRIADDFWPFAFNEAGFRTMGAGLMRVDVRIDDYEIPAYWADGLLVSTSAGSTAYSLSVGGPICMPDVDAHIIAPISPHNFNIRPLVVPTEKQITMTCHPKSGDVVLFMDNRSYVVKQGTTVKISSAKFKVGHITSGNSSFISALRTKLFWGEDRRNEK